MGLYVKWCLMKARAAEMEGRILMSLKIEKEKYKQYLTENEKSEATIQKYLHEFKELYGFMNGRDITKETMVEYRKQLERQFSAGTVNVKLNALNSYLKSIHKEELCLHLLRIQKNVFVNENREMNEKDYRHLLKAAKELGKERLYYLMLTLAGTGIRVSELCYITVESVKEGQAHISNKGKNRTILIPAQLLTKLKMYIRQISITTGSIFRTRTGKPLNRSNICHELKRLCAVAGVDPHKVFPHNFRHLFARAFYKISKNIAHLADILGHSNIETTRIYLRSTEKEFDNTLSKMNLIM
jgi:integrase